MPWCRRACKFGEEGKEVRSDHLLVIKSPPGALGHKLKDPIGEIVCFSRQLSWGVEGTHTIAQELNYGDL